ncbi:MAG TPA: hypothetical protein VHN82_03465, partial [Methanoregula sp.]|nr:hypothetical protein [Methanoregula sp.]
MEENTHEGPAVPAVPAGDTHPITRTSAVPEVPVQPAGDPRPITITSPGPEVPAPPKQKSRMKWLVVIAVGIVLIAAFLAAGYFMTGTDHHRGVTVIRMEGTLVTGDISDADVAGSEAIGRQLREAADDPLVEAIVLRV